MSFIFLESGLPIPGEWTTRDGRNFGGKEGTAEIATVDGDLIDEARRRHLSSQTKRPWSLHLQERGPATLLSLLHVGDETSLVAIQKRDADDVSDANLVLPESVLSVVLRTGDPLVTAWTKALTPSMSAAVPRVDGHGHASFGPVRIPRGWSSAGGVSIPSGPGPTADIFVGGGWIDFDGDDGGMFVRPLPWLEQRTTAARVAGVVRCAPDFIARGRVEVFGVPFEREGWTWSLGKTNRAFFGEIFADDHGQMWQIHYSVSREKMHQIMDALGEQGS